MSQEQTSYTNTCFSNQEYISEFTNSNNYFDLLKYNQILMYCYGSFR